MNVFVLCTGRCGSVTFSKACSHITNYTSGHETRSGQIGTERLNFPPNHIEVDNRFSWMLGRLSEKYGDKAFYVHLRRNKEEVANSYLQRWKRGIIDAYHRQILLGVPPSTKPIDVCLDYYDTVESNIQHFLKTKNHKCECHVDRVKEDFPIFWEKITASGNLDDALKEWSNKHNSSISQKVSK